MKKILIIGANSAMATAAARVWAARGDHLCLAGRNQARLESLAADLKLRGAGGAHTVTVDAVDFASHAAAMETATAALGGIDTALLAFGALPEQKHCEQDGAAARAAFDVNAGGVLSLAAHLANYFEARGGGCIAVIGSVAGDRGRRSNYVYAASKAAADVFLQGLRHRLHARGVQVLMVKPGFVDTPMTQTFRKGFLWASPQRVARDIVRAIDRGKDEIYTPWFWRYIMFAVRLLPNFLFHRMRL